MGHSPAARREDHDQEGDKITLRPSLHIFIKEWLPYAKAAIGFVFLLEIGNIMYFIHHPDQLYLPAFGLTLLLATLAHIFFARNARIEIDSSTILIIDWLGRTRILQRRELVGTALRGVLWPGIPPPAQEVAILYGTDHRCLLKLRRLYWGGEQILKVRAIIGHGHTLQFKKTYASDLEREFPGSLAWWERHNWVAGMLLVALAGALFLLINLHR